RLVLGAAAAYRVDGSGGWLRCRGDDLVEDRLVWQRRWIESRELSNVREIAFNERAFDHRAVTACDGGDVEALHPIDVAAVLALVDQRQPRAHRTQGEHGQPLVPEVRVEVANPHQRVRYRGGERVDRPINAGGRIEQSAGGGRVVHGRPQRRQPAVADVEGLAVHDP